MPIVGTRANASARGYGWSATVPESLDGMVLMMPSSVTTTGTGSSASIGTNGSISFSTCETVSINSVLTADYDNYMVVLNTTTTTSGTLGLRLRAGTTDTSSGYTAQSLTIDGTSETGARTSVGTTCFINSTSTTLNSGTVAYFYGPYLAQPTAWRSITMNGTSSASILEYAGTNSFSSSYDGFTVTSGSSSPVLSGTISIYGLEN